MANIALSNSFQPPWLIRNPHIQTIWSPFLRQHPSLPLSRTRLTLSDGDFLDLDWANPDSSRPLAVLFHGLAGSSNSIYIRGLQTALHKRGFSSVCVNFRGCSGSVNRKLRSYHAGMTDDLEEIFQHVATRQQQLFAVGFSLGGSMLANWLAQSAHAGQVRASALVSVPFKLEFAAKRMQNGSSRAYQQYLIAPLKKELTKKLAHIHLPDEEKHQLLEKIHRVPNNFFAFDDLLTAPIHGFASVDDYYTKSSAYQRLADIKQPTLVIHALDDPFMTPDVISPPPENCNITYRITQHGGHCGFVTFAKRKVQYWAEDQVVSFLSQHLDT